MIQFFEWYLPADGSLWKFASSQAAALAKTGFTSCWLPPAYKGAAGRNEVGYAPYDLYDLGEFRQKGTIGTKYGTRTQFLKCVKDLQKRHIRVVADIVLNHKMGADEKETIKASKVDYFNRERKIAPLHEASVWTKYTFPGRKDKYSDFKWDWNCFTGTDFDQNNGDRSILLFENKHWNSNVSKENGNFDFVMGDDVDFSNRDVIAELYRWGTWFTTTTQISGFRLDAVKSIDSHFFPEWLKAMHKLGNHPDFAVGEFWSGNVWDLKNYLQDCSYCMKLLDVPLHYRLQQASCSNGNFDIRTIFSYTLTDTDPYYACAFVDNHDTQPGQALESWVMDWFKTAAYATILLNRCKVPIVFYGDYYGIPSSNKQPVSCIREMVWIRAHLLSENIVDLNDDDPQKACWMAYGDHPVIVLYTIADWKERTFTEPNYAGCVLEDIANPNQFAVFDEKGTITIRCCPGCCSIFILEQDAVAMRKALNPKPTLSQKLKKAVKAGISAATEGTSR